MIVSTAREIISNEAEVRESFATCHCWQSAAFVVRVTTEKYFIIYLPDVDETLSLWGR